ncbi:hypothetical protein [Streptomyces sp. NPDC048442]|uniref:radical SAM protein n=1 Tax=Streptomyces sp. NPDC048442 TaxID=3154823 RepID=UPI00342E077E
MTGDDWKRVMSQAAALGVKKIQFIGEATLHPDFVELVEHALAEGLGVQVYSNLYRVRHEHGALFARPGVNLATSYYADTYAGHDQATGRKGSHSATLANIIEALRRGIRRPGTTHRTPPTAMPSFETSTPSTGLCSSGTPPGCWTATGTRRRTSSRRPRPAPGGTPGY